MLKRQNQGGSRRNFPSQVIHNSAASCADVHSVRALFAHLGEMSVTDWVESLQADLRIRTEWIVGQLTEAVLDDVCDGNGFQYVLLIRVHRKLVDLDKQLQGSIQDDAVEQLLKEALIAFMLMDMVIAAHFGHRHPYQDSIDGMEGVGE